MSTKFYGFIALTGGTTGCIDNIDGNDLSNDDQAHGVVSGKFYSYHLNSTSGATADGTNIISPAVNPGDKRWILDVLTGMGAKPYHGIETIGALSFNDATHVLTIATGVTYWYKGTQVKISVPVTCDVDTYFVSPPMVANDVYWFYFDDISGTLKCEIGLPNYKQQVMVAAVFWNGTNGAINREFHTYTRDIDWHIWAHDTVGMRYESGLTLTYPTVAVDNALQIESGNVMDEDLESVITQQTTCRIFYKASAARYTWVNSALPYAGSGVTPQFLNTDTYALTNVGASNFAVMWVYATDDIDRPIYITPTHAAASHNTIALARAETQPLLSGMNLSAELKLIYRFIYKGDGAFQEMHDYRLTQALPSGGVATVNAGSVSFIPSGTIEATTVQTAIQELDTEKSPVAGSSDIVTVGTIASGGWHGSTIDIDHGGTGQTTAQAAIDALSAVAAATNEHVLTKDTVTGNAIFKIFSGGVADAGNLPCSDNSTIDSTAFAKFKTLLNFSINVGTLFNNKIVSTYSLVNTVANAYIGGVLDPNGSIHFVPLAAVVGQKISSAGVVSTYSFAYTVASAYYGGVLDPNGSIHFVPLSAVVGQKISITGVVSTYSLVYTTANAYTGGVLGTDGSIHFIPFNASMGQKITSAGVVSTYSLVYTASSAYLGGVLDPDGSIHFAPQNAAMGQKISSAGVVSTYSLVYTTSGAYQGGVLDPNGNIHFVPGNAVVGQKISSAGVVSTYSLVYTTSGAYLGGLLAADGCVHFVPCSAAVGQKISSAGVVSTYSLVYTTPSAYSGGVLDSSGSIHFIPRSAAVGQKIWIVPAIPFGLAVCCSSFLNKL